MSSSLRKLFTTVWSFLKGLLHNFDESVVTKRLIVHLRGVSVSDCQEAITSIQESLGYENVIVLVSATPTDLHAMLSVKATLHNIKEAFEKVPRSTLAAFEPLSQEAAAHTDPRRTQCEI